MLGGPLCLRVWGHASPQEKCVHFKVKCINFILSERSKLRASTHELLVEQRKSIDLYQDNKEGSNILLVMRVSVYITLSMVF